MAVAVERVGVIDQPVQASPVPETGNHSPQKLQITSDFGFLYRRWLRQTHPVQPEDRVRPVARLHSDLKQKIGIGFDTVHEWEQAADDLTMRDFVRSLPHDYFDK